MFGIGSAEAGFILIIVLLLFAPTVVAFLIGYTVGQRRGTSSASASTVVLEEAKVPNPTDVAAPDTDTASAGSADSVETTDD